jgi:hypothetical protein
VRIPMVRAVRATRTATSPRLAMKSLWNMRVEDTGPDHCAETESRKPAWQIADADCRCDSCETCRAAAVRRVEAGQWRSDLWARKTAPERSGSGTYLVAGALLVSATLRPRGTRRRPWPPRHGNLRNSECIRPTARASSAQSSEPVS